MLQVSNTNFTGNSGTNGGAMAMQSTTNATFSGITAVGNSAGCGGGMFVDRAASIQVTHHKAVLLSHFFSKATFSTSSTSLLQVTHSALAAHHAFADPCVLFAEHDLQQCIHHVQCMPYMHTPSLQLQPSEAATGFIVQLHRICLHLQKQMCLAAGSFCCCLLCLLRLNGTACCSVNVYRSRAPLLVDKAKPPFVQANLAKRLTATVRIHFQVVGSNFSRNTAMNGAGFAIQQVTSMSMNNLSIMVRASCQHFTKTDACTFSLMHLGPASCPALAIWFLAKTALYIAFDNSTAYETLRAVGRLSTYA